MAAPLNHGARGKDLRKDFGNTFDEIARMRRKNSAFSRFRRWNRRCRGRVFSICQVARTRGKFWILSRHGWMGTRIVSRRSRVEKA